MKKSILALLTITFIFTYSCSKESSNPTAEPDVTAPTFNFSIAGFNNNSSAIPIVVSNQIEININAQDAGGISKVEAFIDDEKVGEDTSAPYSIIVDVSSLASKTGKTNTFKDYILKVVVTDKSGNSESKNTIINVDNEKPTITGVNLSAGAVINGDNNTVTFDVMDNQELTSVKAFLNNELLIDLPLDNLSININTNNLTDGENVLKIEALDSGENLGSFEVAFISDNTGPEITIESLVENQIIDSLITISPNVNDLYSEVDSLKVFLGDSIIVSLANQTDYSFDFDPNLFGTGANSIKIIATDSLDNMSELIIPIEIYRRLITLNFPSNFYDPQLARIYVFASDVEGNLLDSKRVMQDTDKITLRTIEEISPNSEFMLTIGEYSTGAFGNSSEFTTLQNLTPSTLGEINFKTYPRFDYSPTNPIKFPAQGFDSQDIISLNSEGFGYGGSFYSETEEFSIDRRRRTTSAVNSEFIYVPQVNLTLNEYSYYVADWDIPSDFVFTPQLFTNQNVEKRFYQPILSNGDTFESSSYWIAGYFSNDDFQNNIYHRIDGHGYGYQGLEGIPYYFNSIFTNYKYNVRINDYYTERTGELAPSFHTLDWSIDYSYSNNEIEVIKNGLDHTVGKVFINSDPYVVIGGLNISYRWSLVFDSQKTDNIKLPKIPEEIKTWGFYELYEQGNMEVQQVEIKRYENINSYDEYLYKVIKDNRHSYLVSPVMESKFKSTVPGYYQKAPHFLLD